MTDHAKALADALRQIFDETKRANNVIALGRDGSGQGRTKVATAMHRIAQWADKALTAEAATRENGDLVKRIEEAVRGASNPLGNATHGYHCGFLSGREEALKAILPIIAALSTHQQQGASEAFDKWFNEPENFALRSERAYDEIEPGNKALLPRWLRAAFDAGRLSRSPQPDTVTEAIAKYDAQVEAAGPCSDGNCMIRKPKGQHTNGGCRCSGNSLKAQRMMIAGRELRAALTAALSVRGK